jgi:hypothetical protein
LVFSSLTETKRAAIVGLSHTVIDEQLYNRDRTPTTATPSVFWLFPILDATLIGTLVAISQISRELYLQR